MAIVHHRLCHHHHHPLPFEKAIQRMKYFENAYIDHVQTCGSHTEGSASKKDLVEEYCCGGGGEGLQVAHEWEADCLLLEIIHVSCILYPHRNCWHLNQRIDGTHKGSK